jgi:hypothetical protein
MTDDPNAAVPEWCRLTEGAAEQRREWFRSTLLGDLERLGETDDGVAMIFAGTGETLHAVAEFVRKESACCPFATFEVVVEPPYERTRLTMSAPAEDVDLAGSVAETFEDAPSLS